MRVFQQKEFGFNYQKHAPQKRSWKLWAAGAVFILVLGGAVYFSAFSSYFKIKEIKVLGAQTAGGERLIFLAKNLAAEKWLEILPKNSLAVFPAAALSQKILEEFPQISRAEIKKIFPAALEIKISERQAMGVWCRNEAENNFSAESAATSTPVAKKEILPRGEECFFIDKEGIIFRESPKIFSGFSPLIFGAVGRSFSLREHPLASSTLEFARQAKSDLEKEGLEINYFLENERQKELSAFLAPNWKIYFNLERSPQSQIRIVHSLFDQGLKPENLQYIDLRIPGRAYYK